MASLRPPYCETGLADYLEHTGVHVSIPAGEPDTWTTWLSLLGRRMLFAHDDRGITRVVTPALLRELCTVAGRDTRSEEQEDLLWVTPLPGDIDVLSLLESSLGSSRFSVRQSAALCLGHLGDTQATPSLVRMLRDEDNDARRGAAEALGHLGATEAVEQLALATWDEDESVNAARIEALIRIDVWDQIGALLPRRLATHRARQILRAIVAVEGGGTHRGLAEFLEDDDLGLRRATARYFASRPEQASKASDVLLAQLARESDESVALVLADALVGVGAPVVARLGTMLDDESWRTRMHAAIVLGQLGELAAGAEDALRRRLADDDQDVVREAALAMCLVGVADAASRRALWPRLSTALRGIERAGASTLDDEVLTVCRALLGTGPAGLELLRVAMSGGSIEVRRRATLILGMVDSEMVGPLLVAMARDDTRDIPLLVRVASAAATLASGHPPTCFGVVHRVLLCHSGKVEAFTGGKLSGLDRFHGQLGTLVAKDGDWPVRLIALKLLHRLGESALMPYRELIQWSAMHDPDSDMRSYASEVIEEGWSAHSTAELYARAALPMKGGTSARQRVECLRRVLMREPELAMPLAWQMLDGGDRELGCHVARLLGSRCRPETAGPLIEEALRRLHEESWVQREVACELLGSTASARLGEVWVHRVAQALRRRAREDGDTDVGQAARRALDALGQPFDG